MLMEFSGKELIKGLAEIDRIGLLCGAVQLRYGIVGDGEQIVACHIDREAAVQTGKSGEHHIQNDHKRNHRNAQNEGKRAAAQFFGIVILFHLPSLLMPNAFFHIPARSKTGRQRRCWHNKRAR